ncbi:molybdate ABC transporter substrate-binding protein [Pseudohaliea sp.]|uniref:molybdate ABC transporter substrate-binding protein n=1 Tax=Pseudohaliea sp. TaxID=2740289 RepID=UPI0032EDBA2A
MPRRKRLYALLLSLCLLALPAVAEPLRVAVAANFRATAERAGAAFERETGTSVLLSSAATGMLYNQLRHGAPFDLFLAADAERPRRLAEEGVGLAASRRCYARGRLVLLGGPLAALATPGQRVAIANPTVAPYGVAAEAVLARPPFAEIERRLLRGASVQQAWQFHATGAANLALVARSLVGDGEASASIPADWHAPIEQQGIVVAGGREESAGAFLAWLTGPSARPILDRDGYDPCP